MIYEKIMKVSMQGDKLKKDGKNPFTKKNYPTINSVLETLKPKLEANNLLITQYPEYQGEKLVLTTIVSEAEGADQLKFHTPLQNVSDMQKLGSAITYARRYSLVSLFMLEAEDDDANLASSKGVIKWDK